MTLLWATDVHLDHVRGAGAARAFGDELFQRHPDARGLIVTGDIAEASTIEQILRDLATGFRKPVYFVLGNHDYYGSSFGKVDLAVGRLAEEVDDLNWLRLGPVHLTSSVALVGDEGWYDARYGKEKTPLELTDFRRIEDIFAALDDSHATFLACLRKHADESAARLREKILAVLDDGTVKAVVVATHVPPFVESSWYEGKTADDKWAPYFASRASGSMLVEVAARRPDVEFTVLCGHTHGSGVFRATENLTVYTGGADYGDPRLCGRLSFDGPSVTVRGHC